MAISCGLDDAGDGAHDAFELGDLCTKLFATLRCERVIASSPIAGCDSPLRSDPFFDEHALEGRVKRSFLDLENIVGGTLNAPGDFVSVEFAAYSESFEDQEVKSTGRDFIPVRLGILAVLVR
jgi:hypothetical protein